MRFLLAAVMVPALAVAVACGSGNADEVGDATPDDIRWRIADDLAYGIPRDVEYQIVQDLRRRQFDNRIVDIRLNKEISEETLRAISHKVRDLWPDFEFIFINYYLPGTDYAERPDIVVMFNPDYLIRATATPR